MVTHQPGDPLEPLIADLRTHLPPRVHVLGADQDAADLADELHEHGLPVLLHTDAAVTVDEGVGRRWVTDPGPAMDVAEDLIELISDTPMMRLDRTAKNLDCTLLASSSCSIRDSRARTDRRSP